MALKRISDLTLATTPLTGAEEVELDVAGSARKCTAQDIADLAGGGGAVDSVNGQTGVVMLDASDIAAPVRTETASYTAALGDCVVQMNVASANDLTVPPNGTVAFPIGAFLEVWQQGAGQTTIVAGSGVTILYDADDTLKLKGQNAGCSLRKVATNTWRLIGKMEAA